MINSIYNFFTGVGLDGSGRTIQDYFHFDNDQLETIHDYIQWAFPTWKPSVYNTDSPLLNHNVITQIKENPTCVDNYRSMYHRMKEFYLYNDHWLTNYDHNHLRITRIIESVAAILGPATAEEFYTTVMLRNINAGSPVNDQSVNFWQQALTTGGGRVPKLNSRLTKIY